MIKHRHDRWKQVPMTYMHGQEYLPAMILWTPLESREQLILGELVLVRRPRDSKLYQGYVTDFAGTMVNIPIIRVFDDEISEWWAWNWQKGEASTGCTIEFVGTVMEKRRQG